MQTILFQGDSITDADRSRDDDLQLGLGYPHLVAASMGFDAPGAYRFLNRGVSGNRSVDLYARIKRDILNLRPDMMSVLIGVNDVWHEIGDKNGVDAEKYERICAMLIEETLAQLPDMRILILEPFVTHGTATDPFWEVFSAEVPGRAAAAKRVAQRFGLQFVPLQAVFDAAQQKAPADYWTRDGVHPTPFGHELIAREWIRAYHAG